MLPKIRGYIKNYRHNDTLPLLAILIISLILCLRNYTFGTFLSGWDTLHPEFNFGLSFERAFFGTFRVEQGLGAVAAHSHMADLPRILLLYISHFVIPLSFLRYFYIFLNLILGSLGMYFVLKNHLVKEKIPSFLGALFYLLNVGTVQIFNVPFEMFTTLFATLPFLFYFAYEYLNKTEGRKKSLFFFALFSLINSPSAYASTLWFITFIGFFIYFFSFSFLKLKNNKHIFKRFSILIFVYIATNLYWILPNIYFVLNHAAEVAHANINILFSDQAFLKNKEFGNIIDIVLLKSFYFDWNVYAGNNNFGDLLSPYISFFNSPLVITAYALSSLILVGLYYLIRTLKKASIPFIALLVFCLLFLINDNFPFNPIFVFLQTHIPFFKEAFRFPEDKIFNLYVFLASILFGFGSLFLVNRIKKINVKIVSYFGLVVSIVIVVYALPSFNGNLINKFMRVKIPNSYFALFDYLKTQPSNLRVANLPINSPYGWAYYNWGYQGAGFLYFGITQPLMDRDFDRWSPYNESYYREMSYAIYSKRPQALKNVITKYDIGYVLLDKSIISPQNPKSVLFTTETEKILDQTGMVLQKLNFGDVELYKINNKNLIVTSLQADKNVNPVTTTTYSDIAYDMFSDYISAPNILGFENVVFAFRDLINNQSKLHPKIVTLDPDKIILNPNQKITGFNPSLASENFDVIPSDLIANLIGNELKLSLYPNSPVFDNTPLSLPIRTSISLGQAANLKLAFNENEIYEFNNLNSDTPISIGKVMLKNDQNNISIFDNTSNKQLSNVPSLINPFFSSCDGLSPVNAGFDENGISVSGKGNICILIPYGFFPNNKPNDLLTSFSFNYKGSAKVSSCLFNQENSQCLYYKDPKKFGNLATFEYALPETKTGKTALKIILEAVNQDSNTYKLDNVAASYNESLTNLSIPQSLIKQAFDTKSNLSFSKVYLPENIIYDPGYKITELKKSNSDCPSLTTNAKKAIVTIDGKKSVEYDAILGSFCDHFSYPNLPHSQSYLVIINSRNQKGLPLTLCATNYTSRKCDIYSNLTSFSTNDSDTFLLPSSDKDGIGYDLNFSAVGILKSPSINYLNYIQIVPVPYQILENISSASSNSDIKINGKVKSFTKINPLFYIADTDDKKTLVSLNLSYEKGFKSYPINCEGYLSCIVSGTLAPFYEKEIQPHVLVDNFANGWIVDNQKVAILFLPQYLEYFGFILLIGLLTYLGLKSFK